MAADFTKECSEILKEAMTFAAPKTSAILRDYMTSVGQAYAYLQHAGVAVALKVRDFYYCSLSMSALTSDPTGVLLLCPWLRR